MASTRDEPDQYLHAAAEPTPQARSLDFSLVLGGPLFQIFRRLHLQGQEADLLPRRLLSITAIAWLPLLLLNLLTTGSYGARVSFFRDAEVHARFLVALPVLIAAEMIVHLRIRPVVTMFVDRGLVPPQDLPRFNKALDSAIQLRNSVLVELALLVLVYFFGLWLWNDRVVLNSSTWYSNSGGRWHLTPAGYWYVFVSLPIAQFILLRWYLRLFIWFRFLWQVCRIKLNLITTHPDRCAGLAFVGGSSYMFGPILFAQGAMLAGVVASRVLYRGESLTSFKLQIGGSVVFLVLAILAPLLMFTPQLAAARRKGLAFYGLLAQRYVEDFEKKWSQQNHGEDLLGSADIQSLADLGNSYSIVREMRAVPFALQDMTRLAIATAAPFLPLLLTVFSLEELIVRIVRAFF